MVDAIERIASEGLLAGLEKTGQAAAILDQYGYVILLNPRGQKHLGSEIAIRDRRLYAHAEDADRRLQKLITDLICGNEKTNRASSEFTLIMPRAEQNLIVRGVSIETHGAMLFKQAKILLTFTTIGRKNAPNPTFLRELFDLTWAEASVAAAIASGENLQLIAKTKDISIETVRSHLKGIFAKTNTKRQVSLAILLNELHGFSGMDN